MAGVNFDCFLGGKKGHGEKVEIHEVEGRSCAGAAQSVSGVKPACSALDVLCVGRWVRPQASSCFNSIFSWFAKERKEVFKIQDRSQWDFMTQKLLHRGIGVHARGYVHLFWWVWHALNRETLNPKP